MIAALSGRPLLDNAVDMPYFVGREPELSALRRATADGLNTLLTADPGMGRTSLLRALMYRLRSGSTSAGFDVVYTRVEAAADADALLDRLTGALAVAVEGRRPDAASSFAQFEAALAHHRTQRNAADERAGTRTILIADDVPGVAGHQLFGVLRDQLWELPISWIVSARTPERTMLTLPPADAFFERRVALEPLTREESAQLVERRVGSGTTSAVAQWAEAAFDVARGNPRSMLDLARDIEGGRGGPATFPTEKLTALSARQRMIASMGRSESMLAAELERLGAASASDEQLLAALGWTRPRAVQVLSRMEDAHVVVAESARTGRGRPKRMYRLTPPEQFQQWLRSDEALEPDASGGAK